MDKETKEYIDSKINDLLESGERNFRQIKVDVTSVKKRVKKIEDSL